MASSLQGQLRFCAFICPTISPGSAKREAKSAFNDTENLSIGRSASLKSWTRVLSLGSGMTTATALIQTQKAVGRPRMGSMAWASPHLRSYPYISTQRRSLTVNKIKNKSIKFLNHKTMTNFRSFTPFEQTQWQWSFRLLLPFLPTN